MMQDRLPVYESLHKQSRMEDSSMDNSPSRKNNNHFHKRSNSFDYLMPNRFLQPITNVLTITDKKRRLNLLNLIGACTQYNFHNEPI